ncbi:MAG: hypothetical protein HY901_25550 [Deltaproteobacteria bacterium]|nr:hypothetical protein [Deltaproteobacteria bacterium]
MLEILCLVWFGRRLAEILAGKGRSKGWVALGILFWVGGELMGGVVGQLLGLGLGGYGLAILFAVIGALVAYAIVKSLPPLNQAEPSL